MSSWVRTITSPFRKACTFLINQDPTSTSTINRDQQHKSHQVDAGQCVQDLHGEVMACGYEDVLVMWSILDKSQLTTHNQLQQPATDHFLREGRVR